MAITITAITAFARGGGLNAPGCHHDRQHGGYHCHTGALNGQTFNTKDQARMRMIAPPAPAQGGITGKPRIIDGDTIEIGGHG